MTRTHPLNPKPHPLPSPSPVVRGGSYKNHFVSPPPSPGEGDLGGEVKERGIRGGEVLMHRETQS
jgi:hypothetical protein